MWNRKVSVCIRVAFEKSEKAYLTDNQRMGFEKIPSQRQPQKGVPLTRKMTVRASATKGHRESPDLSAFDFEVSNLACGDEGGCRGVSCTYLPGMLLEITAHLLPYTACAARIFLSSSSVNGPRFTVGLSWLHHLWSRVGWNNENQEGGG
jgi:hypothetical protein